MDILRATEVRRIGSVRPHEFGLERAGERGPIHAVGEDVGLVLHERSVGVVEGLEGADLPVRPGYAAASFTNATSRCSSTGRCVSGFDVTFTMQATQGVAVALADGVRFAGGDEVQPLAASAATRVSPPSTHRYGLKPFDG